MSLIIRKKTLWLVETTVCYGGYNCGQSSHILCIFLLLCLPFPRFSLCKYLNYLTDYLNELSTWIKYPLERFNRLLKGI